MTKKVDSSSSNNTVLPIHKYLPDASRIIYGAMQLGGGWDANPISAEDEKTAEAMLNACVDKGINVIDLADIYTFGKAETVVGRVLKKKPSLADSLIIQSKVGIRLTPDVSVKHYDLSPEYVEQALDASLKRLQMEKLDVLFLHRPDPLCHYPALAAQLQKLYDQDKFECLAVSNMHAGQIMALQQHMTVPIVANQLEMSLKAHGFVDDGITVNMEENSRSGFPRGTLEFCQQTNMQLQSWGSLAQGQLFNRQAEQDNIRNTAELIYQLAESYYCSTSAILLAWLMQHPIAIQPVVGTLNVDRIASMVEANNIVLKRQDWYKLFESIKGQPVP